MYKKLFIPGPTEVRQDILDAQAEKMIGHRMKAFTELYTGIIKKLQELLETQNFITVLTASGTAFMEGAIRNCVKKDVLCCVNGAFSDRWFKIAQQCDRDPDAITLDWGKAIKPEMVDAKLKEKKYEAVTLVQNETSTGVRNPIEEIAEVIKKYPDVLFLVDTVSSLMGDKIEIEKLNIDVCFASSQKAFALPPGLAVCAVSDKALEKAKNRYKRHVEMARFVQTWGKKNFSMFSEPGYESITVSCMNNTKNISVADLNSELGKRGFAISNGYGKLKEQAFRIAHMGDLTLDEIKELITNIDEILKL
jgi:aspartate aminotransferase-like enzyme